MENEDDYFKEVEVEIVPEPVVEQQPPSPGVVVPLDAGVDLEDTEKFLYNPESPSQVPLSPVASPGPAFPADPVGYNSEDEAFGAQSYRSWGCSTAGVVGVCSE